MKTKYLCLLITMCCLSNIVYSQTSTQNYIRTRTYTTSDAKSYLDKIDYFDGLGRPMQSVQVQVTPNKADLISYQEYDNFGKESNTWLPTIKAGNNGVFVALANFKTASTATYNNTTQNSEADTKPYSVPVYEQSPLDRIIEQHGPGNDWYINKRSVRTSYLTNQFKASTTLIAADSLVCGLIRYTASTTYSYSQNYGAGELFITRVKDEDNNTSYEFRDKLGQVVLARQVNGNQLLDTYYIYDDHGNLSAIFPPEASDLIYKDKSQLNTSSQVRTRYAYLYVYDNRNRCIKKKLPGADWINYVYDKADRLIFTQDGEQKKRGEWCTLV